VFASHWNGTGLISGSHGKEVSLSFDASGSWGCGAWCRTEWFQLQWKGESQNLQIAIKELTHTNNIVLWGQKWVKHNVLAYCDNEAIVYVLNKWYSKDPYMVHMIHTIFFIEAHFQFQPTATHIPGSHNTLTNFFSRNQVPRFRTQHHEANIFPLCVPLSLLQWLLDLQNGLNLRDLDTAI